MYVAKFSHIKVSQFIGNVNIEHKFFKNKVINSRTVASFCLFACSRLFDPRRFHIFSPAGLSAKKAALRTK